MKDYIIKNLKEIMAIDSPSGYTKDIIDFLEREAHDLGFKTNKTNKGNLEIFVDGKDNYTIGLCAHVDTLGLMVSHINSNGTLGITNIGGPLAPTLDGEYCRIITRDNQIYTGTILSNSPAVHVYEDAKTLERSYDKMHVRIDEVVSNKEDVLNLGINHGDYITIDTKTTITPSEFIKSRFLDDKMSVSILFGILKYISTHHIIPDHSLVFIISTFEEVGHGCASINESISELLAVDMGCIGKELACKESDVSICAKDSSGPYDYEITTRLITLSKEHQLNYAVDVYPYYGSDASAALRGGNNIKAGLIGPGVAASHGMERTHIDGVMNTYELIKLYLNI